MNDVLISLHPFNATSTTYINDIQKPQKLTRTTHQ